MLLLNEAHVTKSARANSSKLSHIETEVPMSITTNGLVGLLVIIVLILAIIYFAKRV